jgi:hypothetical protein
MSVALRDLGLAPGATATNLWTGETTQTLRPEFTATVRRHGAQLYRLSSPKASNVAPAKPKAGKK